MESNSQTMLGRSGLIVIAMAGLLAALAPQAAAQPSNPARCEALRLKKQSAYYDCLSRCDRRVARGHIDQDECEARCERALFAAEDRVEQSVPCQPEVVDTEPPVEEPPPPPAPPPVVAPDPARCEAQALQIEARHMICHGRCLAAAQRRAEFDPSVCELRCDQRAETSIARLLAKPICALGRMPVGQARQAGES